MAKLLFKLNGVPDDEADDVRDLLESNEIDFYETSAGIWGLSFAAIWLSQEAQFETGKQLLEQYQEARYASAQERRLADQAAGISPTYWQVFKHSPFKITAVLIFVIAVIYFSIQPFFGG